MPRRLAALAAKLARLHAAQDKLAARQAAPAGRTPGSPPPGTRWTARAAAGGRRGRPGRQDGQVPGRGGRREAPGGQEAGPGRAVRADGAVRKNLATAQPGWPPPGRPPRRPAKVSATDPDSRLLPAKNGGGWLQGWNLQLAAARRQVLLAIELHDNPADAGALATMIEAAAANCELAGWPADPRLAGRQRVRLHGQPSRLDHLMLLVAVRRGHPGRPRRGQPRAPGLGEMAARLATPAGKKLYKRRAGLVEPAFAQLFARFGRYLNYRGHDAADAEIKLLATVHNLAKLFEYRRRHPAPAP